MKQRRKILLALLLSASVAATPVASIPVLAENLDIASEEVSVESADEDTDTADDSVLADNAESADLTVEDEDTTEDADTDTDSDSVDLFNDGEVDEFSADSVSAQDTTEAKTHSIKVNVVNSEGNPSGMYAMDSAVATKQDDGTYLVRMHQTSVNRNYMALTNDKDKATKHEVDWYVSGGDDGYWYTIPVANLTDTIYASFSYTKNVNAGKPWSNVQTITFDVNSMAETDEKDAVASDINILEAGILSVTNQTLMFNVEKAVFKDNKLIVTLHGQGYHYLYKGTYEEAVANGDNRDNWIAGKQVNGKWQFTIPVTEGETNLPIVAISNSYLTKYEQGKNTLERAFYPRQAVIDQDAATLVTGDYNHTKDLTVSNSVKMFKVDAATLDTIGGPNSNNYKEILHLTMGSDSFDKVFIGSAEYAVKAETTTAITKRKADLVIKENGMGGSVATDYLDKEVPFSFHSVKNNTWYERIFNVSKANGTLTIRPAGIPATSITLNITSRIIETGRFSQLIAAVAPGDTTDKVTWSSSNEAVAKVSADGAVTASKAGTAVITATAGNVKAECTFTVVNPVYKVTGIKLAATPSRNIAAGKKVQLKATVAPSNATNKAVTWTTSNKKVATVNSNGVVTFKKNAGGKKVTITATAKDGSKKSQKITLTCMKGSVKSIKLSAKTILKRGKTTKVKATVYTQKGKANKKVVWSSSNTKLATVDKNGKVKAVKGKKGTVKITARATDGSGKKATIKIKIK